MSRPFYFFLWIFNQLSGGFDIHGIFWPDLMKLLLSYHKDFAVLFYCVLRNKRAPDTSEAP